MHNNQCHTIPADAPQRDEQMLDHGKLVLGRAFVKDGPKESIGRGVLLGVPPQRRNKRRKENRNKASSRLNQDGT